MLIGRSFRAKLPKPHFFYSSSSDKGTLVPLEVGGSDKFYQNVHGVEMKKHILPYNTYNIPWREEEMKEYRKKIPTYVVILVSKVLEGAEQHAIKE